MSKSNNKQSKTISSIVDSAINIGIEKGRKSAFDEVGKILKVWELKLKSIIHNDYCELKVPQYQKEMYYRVINELKKKIEELKEK